MTVATKFWTRLEIWTKFKDENDIDDEDDFVDKAEVTGWMNDAIDQAEAVIHTNYEDYFLKPGNVALTENVDTSDLPTDIYAHKIRSMIYTNGNRIYEITHLPTLQKFLEFRLARSTSASPTDELCYFIVNTTPGAPKIKWSPVPKETSATNVEIWYYRQANYLVNDADVCDIPDFVSYVFDYLSERLEWKRRAGSPEHVSAQEKLQMTMQLMINTLKDMIVDGNDEIEQDRSHYEEHL